MPALQVRDFPEDLYEELRERASGEHRSIAQQTVVAVREHLAHGMIPQGGTAGSISSFPNFADPYTHPYATPGPRPADPEALRQRRQRVLEKIHRLPAFDLPPEYADTGEFVCALSQEREDHLMDIVLGGQQ